MKTIIAFMAAFALSGCATVELHQKKNGDTLDLKATSVLRKLDLDELAIGDVKVIGVRSDQTTVATKAAPAVAGAIAKP